MRRPFNGLTCLLVLAFAGLAAATQAQERPPAAGGWRTFEGNWSLNGQRHTLPTEGARPAAIVRLSGSLVVAPGEGLGRGFRGELIGFDDGRDVNTGRSVWTDEHGDRIFSELKGEPLQTGRRILGTITGGTGRYAGITGDFSLTWQYVVEGDAGEIQGRSVDLQGRFRAGGAPR